MRVIAAADVTREPRGVECQIKCARGAYYGESPCGEKAEPDAWLTWNCTRPYGHLGVHAAHTAEDKGPVRVWEQAQ